MPTRWNFPSLIGSYVSDYTGTWFEICEDQPNFYIGEYRKRKPDESRPHGTAASPTLVWITAAGSAAFRCTAWI